MIHGSASGAGGDEQRTQRWYRQAKETKRGEMGGRESQRLIVPSKRGNQTEGPRRGKEMPSHEPLKGNMPGTLRHELCSHNKDGSRGSRIHEMRNRVRVMCKPGSEGGRGGQPPRSTRPNGFLGHAKPLLSRRQSETRFREPRTVRSDLTNVQTERTTRNSFLVTRTATWRRTNSDISRDCSIILGRFCGPLNVN